MQRLAAITPAEVHTVWGLLSAIPDPEVPVQNSLLLAGALSAAGVRYEMHLYPRGVHGLSLATPEVDEPEKHRVADPHIAGWFGQCLEWLDILKTTKE